MIGEYSHGSNGDKYRLWNSGRVEIWGSRTDTTAAAATSQRRFYITSDSRFKNKKAILVNVCGYQGSNVMSVGAKAVVDTDGSITVHAVGGNSSANKYTWDFYIILA